ncbi:DNA protecting protein DprA [Saccharospirillum sp. MSK14-1]|uniref:DNA-processing protein DprA n=1 Tax=Saccharospirillum sp. MSK14-1 TaxID=1897632 RepID=UPI000D34692B|nr:DNA-processing protein DprA [Saccharospirillum sp. MSK14-1]PTY37672.1 DNA protecting protein DprA [Saccharospirillum sp. MSK14-1]
MNDDRLLWLRWVLTPGLGVRRSHSLLNRLSHPQQLFDRPERWSLPTDLTATLLEMKRLGEQHPVHRQAQAQLRWAEAGQHHLISLQDARYPSLLLEIPDPPLLLWVKGDAELLRQQQVGMVGSRNATLAAQRHARQLGRELSLGGLVITSGGAAGIDGCAHQGALDGSGQTIAVLGCGVDVVYPKSHRSLFEQISAAGALVSEHPLGTQPKPGHFPRRNRIISGLSDALVVVEAAQRSGSLITAEHALEQGREVFALPGDIGNPNAAGCHRLIQDGAGLLASADDLLAVLAPGHRTSMAKPSSNSIPDADLPAIQMSLLALLSSEPQALETLSQQLACSPQSLLEPLLELELGGWIQQQPGGYCRL